MGSDRYLCFKLKGIICSGCGLKGKYFALEKHAVDKHDTFHFNLYALQGGHEILMTKDHVVPVSKGGKSHISNYQTMCIRCNMRKADKVVDSKPEEVGSKWKRG